MTTFQIVITQTLPPPSQPTQIISRSYNHRCDAEDWAKYFEQMLKYELLNIEVKVLEINERKP